MMRTAVILLAGALLYGVCPPAGEAGQITLRTRPASSLEGGRVRVSLELHNAGDAPARSLWVEAAVGASSARSALGSSLAPGERCRAALDLGPAPTPAGTYTVVIRLHYSDDAGRPSCVLSSIPLVTADLTQEPPPVKACLSSAEMRAGAAVILTLTNAWREEISARVALRLPDELRALEPEQNVKLPPGRAVTVPFHVRNRAAAGGSVYIVLATVDYALAGQHRSTAALSRIRIVPSGGPFADHPAISLAAIAFLLALFAVAQSNRVGNALAELAWVGSLRRLFPALLLAAIAAFTLYELHPECLLANTLAVGGDTPAHSYLASHLKAQLFSHGRIVSWAGGWWCGFPMFQFYFCLPYLLTALLSCVIPINIAFKIISVLGILLLPPCAFLAARRMGFPRPVPGLMAVAMVPLLFDATHTMWGVNIYSTLAGMIANSLSFPIMLLFIASAARDSDEGRFRIGSVLLLVAVIASHFFTSVMAGLTVALLPWLSPRAGARKALGVLAREGALAVLLMAWWIVPLLAKRGYSMEFGVNWQIFFLRQLPDCVLWLLPFLLAAAWIGARRRLRGVAILAWMLTVSLLLFQFGFRRVGPVFVNVRLWPFILFSMLALCAAGAGLLIAPLRAREPAVLAALIAAFAWGVGSPNNVRYWAKWNYSGLERKPGWPVFRDLVLPLRGTPGRLANDLSDDNNALGSSRIFECVPHLIGKPVLEGGIVNSAVGSMHSYYVQGESSRASAGYPTLLKPAAFNMAHATLHMELFNVKHFIARWKGTKEALAGLPQWRLLRTSGDWSLYELTSHDGRYVFVPRHQPQGVRAERWKEASLDWLYTINALDQPFALLSRPNARFPEPLNEDEMRAHLQSVATNGFHPLGTTVAAAEKDAISEEWVTDNRIRFRTKAVGAPHVIKCTYYPNWKVRGADRVFMVTPCFMLVYPTQAEVELYYGCTAADNVGYGLTALGAVILAGALVGRRRRRQHL